MSKKVFVVTNPELGWDCVVDVYTAESEKQVEEHLSEVYGIPVEEVQDEYVIHEEYITEIKFK